VIAAAKQSILPRVLLVEDSNTSTVILSRYLRDKFDVLHAVDGVEAWDLLNADERIELVVTDVEMPRLNGHELLQKIRASETPRLRSIPVIVTTTTDNNADRQLAFANGASDFVGKPLELQELQARVRLHQRLATMVRELEASREQLREQASTDPLTRLKNRHSFSDIGRRYFALAKRHRRDLSMVMFHIDQAVDDTHGRPAGDSVLANIAKTLTTITRAGDTPARLGTEQFAVLLPNTDKSGAMFLAERIRQAVERKQYGPSSGPVAVTTSVGVASYGVDAPASLDQLLEVADKRLYLAKQGGRNRVIANS
jgi:two-component system cell cycle response regulator